MRFLLDTDICSPIVSEPSGLMHRVVQYSGVLAISAVTLGELLVWAESRGKGLRVAIEERLLSDVVVLPYDSAIAEVFGRVRAEMIRSGFGIAPLDMQIAATAIAHDLTLVTHNTRHFDRVPGLRLVDWLA